jgi:hypothetical protein
MWVSGLKQLFQEMTGVRMLIVGYGRWCAAGDDLAPAGTTLGAEINDPISCFDNIKIMFDNNDGIAMIAESVKHLQ